MPTSKLNTDYREVYECRGCGGHEFADWLNLDKQPLANALVLSTDSPDREKRYPLEVVHCKDCELVQLKYIVDAEVMFTDYLYLSSTSAVFRQHFEDFAAECFTRDILDKDDLVVDIGSNDGILLKPFKAAGARVLGVEPALPIAAAANANGITTIADYFNVVVADEILRGNGPATLVTMTNVFAHVDYLEEILAGVKKILHPKWGKLIIEVPYLPTMIESGTFDLIYHEHLSYFTKNTIQRTLERYGFRVESIDMVAVHGGSMRVTASVGAIRVTDVSYIEDRDITESLLFKSFPDIVDKNRAKTVTTLLKIMQDGGRIIGYGAPAKASTLLNYYRLDQFHIKFIIDDSPAKQGKMIPGARIPILPFPNSIDSIMADYIFIFAWNFKDSIIERLRKEGYRGKFIIPYPTMEII